MTHAHWYAASVVTAVAALVGACQKLGDHPPGVDLDCEDASLACKPVSGGAGGSAGTGGSDGPIGDASGGVDVTGSVVDYPDSTLLSTEIVTAPYTVTFSVAAGGAPLALAVPAGGAFSASGVGASTELWTSVTVGDEAGASVGFLTTWQALNTTVDTPKTLIAMKTTVLDAMFAAVTPVLSRNVSTAQLVVQFQDGNGVPVAGVKVDTAPGERKLYATLGTWTDTAAGTDTTGLVFLPNALVGTSTLQIVYSLGAHTGQSVSVPAWGGQVTLVGAVAVP